ncbi:MAG: hypothetical protein AAF747_07375 [Planctomycetota bacterium]
MRSVKLGNMAGFGHEGGIDLRRRKRREAAEQIVALAQHLPDPDRQLLEAVFGDGQSVSQVAGSSPSSSWPDANYWTVGHYRIEV